VDDSFTANPSRSTPDSHRACSVRGRRWSEPRCIRVRNSEQGRLAGARHCRGLVGGESSSIATDSERWSREPPARPCSIYSRPTPPANANRPRVW
jgi:hypothetical protein